MRAISTPAAAAASESEEGREMLAGDERASDWNPKLTNDDQIEFHRRKQRSGEERGGKQRLRARSHGQPTDRTAAFVTTVTPEINDSGAGEQTSLPVNVRGTLALALPRRQKLGKLGE